MSQCSFADTVLDCKPDSLELYLVLLSELLKEQFDKLVCIQSSQLLGRAARAQFDQFRIQVTAKRSLEHVSIIHGFEILVTCQICGVLLDLLEQVSLVLIDFVQVSQGVHIALTALADASPKCNWKVDCQATHIPKRPTQEVA